LGPGVGRPGTKPLADVSGLGALGRHGGEGKKTVYVHEMENEDARWINTIEVQNTQQRCDKQCNVIRKFKSLNPK
jgi:hypothetical protein